MGTDAIVVVPWRQTPDRIESRTESSRRWQAMGFTEMLVDSGAPRFNLAASRNLGMLLAERAGHDVVIVADADTFGDDLAIRSAVDAARDSGMVHTPYTEYHSLGRIGSAQLAAGVAPEACSSFVVPGACSGIFVTTPAAWWSIGGMDERFTVWAPEDWAFRLAHEAILGPMPRTDGCAYSLHHDDQPSKASGPEYERCVELYHRYLAAAGDRAAMSELTERTRSHAS